MERAVDKILLENKGKLIFKGKVNRNKKQYSNKTDLESFDVKNFSPVNRKKDSIYFVKDKKKPVKKKETKNLDKKTTKERDSSTKNKPRSPPDESLEKLSPDDAKWLDQQIKTVDTVKGDENKKSSYDITSVASSTLHKDMPDQPKRFEKLLGRVKSRKVVSKSELKKFLSSKRHVRTPKSSGKRIVTEKTQLAVLSKELADKKKYLSFPARGEALLERKAWRSFFGKSKHLKDSNLTSNKLDVRYKQPSTKNKPRPHLDESLGKLSLDDAKWLDQQIKVADTVKGDESKKSSYDITSAASSTLHEDMPDQPKRFEKLLGGVKSRKVVSKSEPKKFFSSKRHVRTPKSSDNTGVDIDKKTTKELDSSDSIQELQPESIVPDGKIHLLEDSQMLKSKALKNLGYSEGTWEELDFYPIQEPFAYVEIIREKETLDKQYISVEVELSKKESYLLDFIKDTLMGSPIDTMELELKGEKKYLAEKMEQILEDYMIGIEVQSKKKIIYFLEKQFLGLDKLEVLMKDPNIEDISCDGSDVPIFLYHRKYGSLKGNTKFEEAEELEAFVMNLAQKCGKHISISEPMLDATMPDGSRIQMTLSTEVTTKGSTFTIRKFKEDPFSPPDLIEFNTMSSEMIAYMWMAVENGINALIAGGTASGKTSTLNALSLFIPRESKIVSIEETREINLPHPNWIPGVSRSGFGEVVGNKVVGEIDLYDLMKAALRQRPEYILVGEIRGREAYALFQAMATGHTTYSTVHADSAQSLIHRLEGKPINIPRIMLQSLDIVCIQIISRVKNKRARRIRQVIEIIDIDPTTKEILTNEVFRWEPVEDKFIYSGKSYILERIRAEKDMSREEMTNEIRTRANLLEWMNKNNVREFKKVATLIAQYFEKPTDLIEKLRLNYD